MNLKSRAILLGGSLLGAALAGAGEITRVSVDSAGNQGNDASVFSAISAGGRYVAFQSSASNLLPAGTSVRPNIFVHDRQSGVTEVVSVDSTGVVRGGGSDGRVSPLELSADGRHVAFTSHFDDLVDEDTNGSRDVFVHDRRSGMTERVSVDAGGRQIFRGGWAPSISAGGRFVTFHSFFKIFVRDREAGTTERIDVDDHGQGGNGGAYYHSAISGDGRYVAFASSAGNLVPSDTNGVRDLFVRDRWVGTTERVSVDSQGHQANSLSMMPAISAGGRYVAFRSFADNLAPDDTNGGADVFVRDRLSGTTTLISVAGAGRRGLISTYDPGLSADGRYAVFDLFGPGLAPDGTGEGWDLFLYDLRTGSSRSLGVATAGLPSIRLSSTPSLSADGRHVAFDSPAGNLVPGDTNGSPDVFVLSATTPAGF